MRTPLQRLHLRVDLDLGRRSAHAEVDGVPAASIPSQHLLRMEGSRWEQDWRVPDKGIAPFSLSLFQSKI
ncbi:hypothetical protein U9M48_034883 [Paspalum notatum var. saurae]|uniref:Uncharacterized protein n=1 Tax=Paspalum notatum var. saurae TaxID=547442 RepID=A0AAQ3UEB2_PASNO